MLWENSNAMGHQLEDALGLLAAKRKVEELSQHRGANMGSVLQRSAHWGTRTASALGVQTEALHGNGRE